MPIRFSKYIDITSSVAGSNEIAGRAFIARLFTTNVLLPSESFIEFTTVDEVQSYFGVTSEEYLRALFYFGWISKNQIRPRRISFARWVNADTAPMIFGAPLSQTLSAFQAITNGSFSLTMGNTNIISGLNFSAATSFTDIATILQTAIRAETGLQWTGATVTYSNTRGSFNLIGGDAIAATVSVAAGTIGTDIASLIGWLPESPTQAIWSNGALTETITQTLTQSKQASNNFGTFLFIPTLTLPQITEAATWNNAIDQNVMFQFLVPVTNPTDATSYSTALINYAGVGITLSPLSNEYPELIPAMILAATDYNGINATQNYMFQINFNVTPSVTTDSDSDFYDGLRINYYGTTQTSGQLISFYQRGKLMGGATDPIDMNTYANEQWLKDAAGVAIMNLFLLLNKISANDQGRSQIITILQTVIGQGRRNGAISVGTTLTTDQIATITQITNDLNAWRQVQTAGYWLDVEFQSVTALDNTTEIQAAYTLVYKKDDVIRSVVGTHVLI